VAAKRTADAIETRLATAVTCRWPWRSDWTERRLRCY